MSLQLLVGLNLDAPIALNILETYESTQQNYNWATPKSEKN